MNTNEHERELQELENELSVMREKLDLLKNKLEGEKILTEELLIAPVLKEKALLEQDFVMNTLIGPLLIFPLIIAVFLFAFDLPLEWRIAMGLILAVFLYGLSIRFYFQNKKKYYSNNVFGMLGNTVEELEQYCRKQIKRKWLSVAVFSFITVADLFIICERMEGLGFTWKSFLHTVTKFPIPIVLPVIVFEAYRRNKRLRTILMRIEELRAGFREF